MKTEHLEKGLLETRNIIAIKNLEDKVGKIFQKVE